MLRSGTLYGALKRLLEQGWIERVEEKVHVPDETAPANPTETGRARKAYARTELGRRILQAEVEPLQSLVALTRLRTAEEGL